MCIGKKVRLNPITISATRSPAASQRFGAACNEHNTSCDTTRRGGEELPAGVLSPMDFGSQIASSANPRQGLAGIAMKLFPPR
jgi:hypothetical protein